MHALRTRIAANLATFTRVAIDLGERRHAAVGIILSPTPQGPAYLMTRRALHMRRGAGNYALPGGNLEPGEDAIDAARREALEEVGVDLPREAALGLLDDFVTLGGHVVTPVVFWSSEPLVITPNPEEVAAAWLTPVADLDHPDAPRRETNPQGGPNILKMPAQNGWVNPPTAAFLWQFREVAMHGREARTHDIGQPGWTAR